MFDFPFSYITYKDRDKELQLKKHKATCAKNRKLRKSKKK